MRAFKTHRKRVLPYSFFPASSSSPPPPPPPTGRTPLSNNTIHHAVQHYDSPEVLAQFGPIEKWDTSQVTDMQNLFAQNASFNRDIAGWDVSNVTNMDFMFLKARSFNQPLAKWDVSNVTSMRGMFSGASDFNQPISAWDVSRVTNMSSMFSNTRTFNQPIGRWDVSRVKIMIYMFENASAFNQSLSDWKLTQVQSVVRMFAGASSFNQSLAKWNVSQIVNMFEMFSHATAFNGNVSTWDVSNVKNMASMFERAIRFNSDISNWDVSNVETMDKMFKNAQSFNQDISAWDVAQVTSMDEMFCDAVNFDQDISLWHARNASRIDMFRGATSFSFEDETYDAWDASEKMKKDEEDEEFAQVSEAVRRQQEQQQQRRPMMDLAEVSEVMKFYYKNQFPKESKKLVFKEDEVKQSIKAKTCKTGCHCLNMYLKQQPFTHFYLAALRFPMPSFCALDGNQLLEGVKYMADTYSVPIVLSDSATKTTKSEFIMFVAVISIMRTGKTWYQRAEFVPYYQSENDWSSLNEELRKMTVQQFIDMNRKQQVAFYRARPGILFPKINEGIHLLSDVIDAERLHYRFLDFFTNDFFAASDRDPILENEQRSVYEVVNSCMMYPRKLIYIPKQ